MKLKRTKVDLYINNKEDKIYFKDIEAQINEDKLLFDVENEKHEIIKDDNLQLKKENKDSIINFIFKENKKTNSIYFIKEYNTNINIYVKTNMLYIKDNNIEVNYTLWIEEELIGDFYFRINIKEQLYGKYKKEN